MDQISLARQADLLLGPSGNELGLGAFMRRGTWLIELMPKAVQSESRDFYEFTNCREGVDANPGSLVGHLALRTGVRHLCVNVNRHRVFTTSELSSPHWRFTPEITVELDLIREVFSIWLKSALSDE
eukprot:TRINITY_DN104870_c0_g1_i1.p1 TRINITY_DN104870_c0_g1~~TRINITY_DN104870_c0_g1_i1.p1  ORF type:complete len:139 (+),score=15.60 TRINITY_DN104870_c0_g1_i1:39-419(+)